MKALGCCSTVFYFPLSEPCCSVASCSVGWASMVSSIVASLDAGGKLSPKMFWLCFEGWSPVSRMYRRLSWVLTRVGLNTPASLIPVIVIKLLGERVAWQLLWCFPFHPFCILPLTVTRQYIKAACKHSQVRPAGMVFNCKYADVWLENSAAC